MINDVLIRCYHVLIILHTRQSASELSVRFFSFLLTEHWWKQMLRKFNRRTERTLARETVCCYVSMEERLTERKKERWRENEEGERRRDTTLMTAKSLLCKFKGERKYVVKKNCIALHQICLLMSGCCVPRNILE